MGRSGPVPSSNTITGKRNLNGQASSSTRKSFCSPGSTRQVFYEDYHLTKADVLKQGGIGLFVGLLASYCFYRWLPLMILIGAAGAIGFPFLRKEKLKQQRLWKLTIEFREAIWLVSGFLSAGLSVENAFLSAIPELVELYSEKAMIVQEFVAIGRGIRINRPIEELLGDFAYRSGVADIRNFAEVFVIAKRSGGNMREIIEKTSVVIRDKTTVAEEIKTMTAARRYEQSVMNFMPFGIILYINLTSGGFLDAMYEGLLGRGIMTACMLSLGAAYLLSQKFLDIRV